MEQKDLFEDDKFTGLENTDNTVIIEPPSRLRRTFTALRYRNYRLWFWGQMTSLLGTWMQITAQGFLIYELTHSPVFLGYVGFAAGIPSWLFMLYGGVIADRFPKRDILLITQVVMMVLAAILAVFTFLNIIQPWEIVVLAFLLGITNAFDAPSRQAFVNELVDREDLTNAIALNSTMFNTATATGPAIAGITYALFGPAWCFTINAVSFIGIIIALRKMKMKEFVPRKRNRSTFEELKEGVHYVFTHPVIRTIVILVGIISVFGLSFATLLPAWAVKILGGDATTNGFLQSARGVGALSSALFIASLGRFKFKGKLLTIGSFGFPALLVVFSFIHWLPFSLLALIGLGASLILVFNIANALIQTLVTDDLRGRVMGVYTFTFFGFMPIGSLIMGTLAEHFGEPTAVITGAIVTLSVAISIFIFMPSIRKLH
ncbi:MAG: MFS transporter [Ignavibacteriae bacterium]|nr:MAG: MFS transporter [Ignavibacteriota bacterium]